MIDTISGLLEHYISRKPLEPITIRNYRNIVTCFERIATSRIDQIDEEICLAWRAQILKKRTTTTYNSYLRLMRALFSYGVERNLVPDNPFKLLYFSPRDLKRPEMVTDEVLATAIRYLDSHDNPGPGWFWSLLVRFMSCTGVRARQVVALEWQDLDWSNRLIRLRAAGSKTRREWEIPLMDSLAEPLERLRTKTAAVRTITPSDQVFNVTVFSDGLRTRYSGNRMKVEQINDFFCRLSNKIGTKISSRRIRHYLATKLANSTNPDIFAIQDLLGHTDIRTTRIYVQTDVERIRKLLLLGGVR